MEPDSQYGTAMPRYYFKIHRGDQVVPDLEGTHLPSPTAARNEAAAIARELLAERLRFDAPQVREAVETLDEHGQRIGLVEYAAVVVTEQ